MKQVFKGLELFILGRIIPVLFNLFKSMHKFYILILSLNIFNSNILIGNFKDSTNDLSYILNKLGSYLNEQGYVESNFQFGNMSFLEDGYYNVSIISEFNNIDDINKTGRFHRFILKFKPTDIYDYDTATYWKDEVKYIQIKMLSQNKNIKWTDTLAVYNLYSNNPQISKLTNTQNYFSIYFDADNKNLAIKFIKMFRELLLYYREYRNEDG